MQANFIGDLIRNLGFATPTILVCILGIVFALVQREKAHKAATFVIISLVVLLLITIVRPIGFSFLTRMEGETKFTVMQIYGFVFGLIDLATTAGLIFAVFCDRETPMGVPDPFAKQFTNVPPYPGPSFPGPAPLPPLGGSMRPPQA
ncbi:MAG: hypothetical protein ACKVP0_07120 [Pirellulaceae bacterium]